MAVPRPGLTIFTVVDHARMETLFTPWRFSYVTGAEARSQGCFLCRAAAAVDDAAALVLTATDHHLVLLNRHPYSNGHLMVAPRAHVSVPTDESGPARDEFWPLVLRCCRILEDTYRPHALNLGANLGGAAGAGVPGHFHFHVVPRWEADTNFMTVVAGTRVIPEDLEQTRDKLRSRFREEG